MLSKRPLHSFLATTLILAGLLTGVFRVVAQPTVLSVVPNRGAAGVATNTTVVFTFSDPMNTGATSASFFNSSFMTIYFTSQSWSAGDTVLTCTPTGAFAPNDTVTWFLTGEDANGEDLDGTGFDSGTFTTGASGGGGSGSGTNAFTIFSVGKVHHYNQTSAGAPVLDPTTPYGLSGVTALQSNRVADAVSLTSPTGAVYNLTHLLPPSAEVFLTAPIYSNLSAFDAAFPAGNYSFFVQGSTNQTVIVTLSNTTAQPQPGAPHVSNFAASQAVNPNQNFVLSWDAFPGGTTADYIDVDVGSYSSPDPKMPGALTGTATSFTIPAGTLQPNASYYSRVGFFRFSGTTNISANYTTAGYRATYTEFYLFTTGSQSLMLTNPVYAPLNFSFDVLCTNGQTVTVEYRTNLAIGTWQTLFTTNNVVGSRFHAVAPQAVTNKAMFFRARNGS